MDTYTIAHYEDTKQVEPGLTHTCDQKTQKWIQTQSPKHTIQSIQLKIALARIKHSQRGPGDTKFASDGTECVINVFASCRLEESLTEQTRIVNRANSKTFPGPTS